MAKHNKKSDDKDRLKDYLIQVAAGLTTGTIIAIIQKLLS